MFQSKNLLLERFTPILFLGVAVLAWVLIQHSMATQLQQSDQLVTPSIVAPDSSQMSNEEVLEWATQIQRYGYQVTVTMQAFGTTVWLRHPNSAQWEVMFFPLSPASSPTIAN